MERNAACAEAYLRTKWHLDPSSRLGGAMLLGWSWVFFFFFRIIGQRQHIEGFAHGGALQFNNTN